MQIHADWLRPGPARSLPAGWFGEILGELVSWVVAGYCVYVVIAAVSRLRCLPESPVEIGVLAVIALLIGSPSIAAHIGKNGGFD